MAQQGGPIIAILEDDPRRQARMRELVLKRFPAGVIEIFDRAAEFVQWLNKDESTPDVISLDFDLHDSADMKRGEADGLFVARYLAAVPKAIPILIHSSNADGADSMFWELKRAGYRVNKVYPFNDLEWVESDWIDQIEHFVASV